MADSRLHRCLNKILKSKIPDGEHFLPPENPITQHRPQIQKSNLTPQPALPNPAATTPPSPSAHKQNSSAPPSLIQNSICSCFCYQGRPHTHPDAPSPPTCSGVSPFPGEARKIFDF